MAEQDRHNISEPVLASISVVMHISNIYSKDLTFTIVSSAMHSVNGLGEDNEPLTDCITWADNRSHAWTEKLHYDGHGHHIYPKTGTPIHSMSPLSKIIWLENDYPSIAEKTK